MSIFHSTTIPINLTAIDKIAKTAVANSSDRLFEILGTLNVDDFNQLFAVAAILFVGCVACKQLVEISHI